MLALASLQGNLTRSSSDANMRTVAANIAEQTIEDLRAFQEIETTAGKKA
jgi:Tfp pilus assembly protein PilV